MPMDACQFYYRCSNGKILLRPNPGRPPHVASAAVPAMLAALNVNPEAGLTHAEAETRRRACGYNEVAGRKGHPALMFFGKFWGVSAWMLELIMVLSAVLGRYSELTVVIMLLVDNAVLRFIQEHRAAGLVETLRQQLQVSARLPREATWQVFPARKLVPGDIIRVRPGDIIPADVKLLTGVLSIDQSALTGESKDVDKAPGEVLSSGSVVRQGEGNGVAILTGAKTYFGRTTELVQEARPKLHIEAVVARWYASCSLGRESGKRHWVVCIKQAGHNNQAHESISQLPLMGSACVRV